MVVDTGITVKSGDGMTRVQVTCGHQSGLIYVVPASRSWVCSEELLPAHALAGFFRELVALKHGPVAELMQDWGIYYRQLPIAGEGNSEDSIESTDAPSP